MDPIALLARAPLPGLARSRLPEDLEAATVVGEEEGVAGTGVERDAVERIWRATLRLAATGVYPALSLCIRRRGRVVLERALGFTEGAGPDDPPDAAKRIATPQTPFCLFSASKAVTAMVVHKLDEERLLHIEDRVCDHVPEFRGQGKEWITIRHLLTHRAGIPNIPPEAMDLDLLGRPEAVLAMLCDMKRAGRPGRLLAYHAVSGGFVLGEVVRRAAGAPFREVAERLIAEPLGARFLRFGVRPEEISEVAVNAATGPPPPPPVGWILKRALGAGLREVVEISNDPRFLTGVVPSANLVATARELADFYQCLLQEGELDGVRVFAPRTVRHAVSEQAYREVDLTLGIPVRYGLGLMLGDDPVGLFGLHSRRAFGHVGFTNVFGWADPDREIAVALLTSGKPILSLHAVRVLQWMIAIDRAFPRRSA